MCKHKTLTHLWSQGRKEGPCGSLARLSSQPLSFGFRERLGLKKNQTRAMVENISVDLWPLHAHTSATVCTNMYTTIVKTASYSGSLPLNSLLSLPSSTARVPFLPVPRSWKWSSLWLGAQAEGFWGLGWGFTLSGVSPFFQVPHWRRISGWFRVKQN